MPAHFACVLDGQIAYEARSLAQAQGFADGGSKPCRILVDVVPTNIADWLYRISLVDRRTGQLICDGPLVDLVDAADLMQSLAIVVLPADVQTPDYLLREKTLADLVGDCDCEGECDCDDDDGDEWQGGVA